MGRHIRGLHVGRLRPQVVLHAKLRTGCTDAAKKVSDCDSGRLRMPTDDRDNLGPKGCIRWSRTSAADPLLPVTLPRGQAESSRSPLDMSCGFPRAGT